MTEYDEKQHSFMYYVERTAAKQDKLLLGGKLFVIF